MIRESRIILTREIAKQYEYWKALFVKVELMMNTKNYSKMFILELAFEFL